MVFFSASDRIYKQFSGSREVVNVQTLGSPLSSSDRSSVEWRPGTCVVKSTCLLIISLTSAVEIVF